MAECVCQRYCAHRKKPICGTDGMVYENHCELHRAACILERPITFQKMEKCSTISKKKNSPKKFHEKEKKFVRVSAITDLPTEDEPNFEAATTEQRTIVIVTKTTPLPFEQTVPQIPKEFPEISSPHFGNRFGNLAQATIANTGGLNGDDTRSVRKGYCSPQEYEIMKDNLLLYSHTRLMSQDNNHSKDFLVSIMFSHYDQNNNGHLEQEELSEITMTEHLDDLSNGCLLNDMLIFDDVDNDRQLSINEFYQAFNKLYSLSVVSLDKALETNHLSAQVGDNVEIKCDVSGSPSPPIIWKRYSTDLSSLAEDEVGDVANCFNSFRKIGALQKDIALFLNFMQHNQWKITVRRSCSIRDVRNFQVFLHP